MADQYIHPCDKMEARFRRTYPWRKCDEATRKAFYGWQGKRLNLIGKERVFSDFELGLRNVMNGEKTELELEKLTASWEAFVEQQDAGVEAKAVAVATLKQAEAIMPMDEVPIIGPQQHLARLQAMWSFPRHREFVTSRVKANPEWGIVIGANGPELADELN